MILWNMHGRIGVQVRSSGKVRFQYHYYRNTRSCYARIDESQ